VREKRYFNARLTVAEADELIAVYTTRAVMLADPTNVPAVIRDPNDDYLVVLAQTAEADAIVTGDRDLLDHAGLQPPAIRVRAACEQLGLSLAN
jgi:predicted nucleic acid-binding protein